MLLLDWAKLLEILNMWNKVECLNNLQDQMYLFHHYN